MVALACNPTSGSPEGQETALRGDLPQPRVEPPAPAAAETQAAAKDELETAAAPATPIYTPRPDDLVEPVAAIETPNDTALDPFYAALARADRGDPGALVRVTHFGDSSIGHDGLPHAIRTQFQARFGDGGPGFVLLHPFSPNVSSRLVSRVAPGAWETCVLIYGCKRDGHYGLGGHTAMVERGARARVSLRAEVSTALARFELWYAARPGGGKLSLRVDEDEAVLVETNAAALEDRWHELTVEPGPHVLRFKSQGPGPARVYGLVLEGAGPGVIWESISFIGAYTRRLKLFNAEHIARQVAHRDPDLIVFNFGGNDLRRFVDGRVTAEKFHGEVRDSYQRVLAGKPGAACLVVSVIDHGRSGGSVVKARHVDAITSVQRAVAFELGCGFFDSLTAMGGPRAIFKWRKAKPPLAAPDLKHLNHRGWELMGRHMYEALLAGYVAYRRRADAPDGA